jgi:hypothetical protein
MSDLLINIRVGLYHFQLRRWWTSPWFEVSRNDYHRGYKDGFFAVYEFFGWAPRETRS